MENESRFCVGFYCGLHSTQRTVVIESIIELTLIITCRMYKVNFFSVLWRDRTLVRRMIVEEITIEETQEVNNDKFILNNITNILSGVTVEPIFLATVTLVTPVKKSLGCS